MENSKIKNPQVFKHCVLEYFRVLLKHKLDFSGFPELEKYFSCAEHAELSKKNIFTLFCIYRLSYKLRNKELKDFECDCSKDITNLYKTTYYLSLIHI